MSVALGLVAIVLLTLATGYFVAQEFAYVSADRIALSQQAPLIAGTLAPLFDAVGLPEAVAHAVAFVVALAVVTFLHMVLGEMAPKSWAIAHPERSATLLALPFRGFTLLVRPLISALNAVTNGLLRLFRVRPDEAGAKARTPDQLRHLVAESRRLGLIEADDHVVLSQALQAPQSGIAALLTPAAQIVGVPATAAAQLAYRVPDLPQETSVADAVARLRAAHSQIALIRDDAGTLTGLVTLDDLLTTLLLPA
ncbi:CNNM domain-containing protein [Nonomuraea sp. NPDC049684]|uniref:CNNM domain-containing protein n=1 Tax=Nonomuraea sp. NPDC049684 TaxID=3364356 RepID=UPI0037B9CD22